MTAAILAILDTEAKLIMVLIQSQTPDQQKILWDRYIERTEMFHRWLVKLENLGNTQEAPK